MTINMIKKLKFLPFFKIDQLDTYLTSDLNLNNREKIDDDTDMNTIFFYKWHAGHPNDESLSAS